MITLILLHPLQSVPVQSWTFKTESVIRIGRSADNNVVLYSAVVSRRHVEIKNGDAGWEVMNLGANGTYIDGKRITRTVVEDKMIIRLATSGPKIQIRLDSVEAALNMESSEDQHDKPPKDNSKNTLIS